MNATAAGMQGRQDFNKENASSNPVSGAVKYWMSAPGDEFIFFFVSSVLVKEKNADSHLRLLLIVGYEHARLRRGFTQTAP